MSKRTSTARYTLPLDINPSTTVDFCVKVPNDIYHIGAFLGQIYALSRAYSWANDSGHTAKLVANRWRDIFDNLRPDNCGCVQPVAGADEGVEQLIRQNPDNPCLLETSINGTDWCAFADLSKCIPAGSQPGSGAPIPGAGQSQCYAARMQGSGKWLLPYQVNAGDVITISQVSGAATDGSGIWYCGNGQTYFLGACAGATTTSSGDPKNTTPHMRLIAKIGSTYYDAYNTSITVPSGVIAANVEFQVNDSSLSDNFGELTFEVCVANNGSPVWEHSFDFTTNSWGWVTHPGDDGGKTYAIWTPGVGWVANCTADDGGANLYQQDSIRFTALHASSLTSVHMVYTRTAQGTPAATIYDEIQIASTFLVHNALPQPNGTNLAIDWAGVQAIAASDLIKLRISQNFQGASGHSCPLTTPNAIISSAIFRGTGVDPFV